jgi:hypothetical protein
MLDIGINPEKFKFKYLPDFADYLLKNKLNEFVLTGIRFCRQEDLPVLKPLSKYSEEELVAISIESNRQILEAVAANKIADLIQVNAKKWVENTMGILDKNDINAEDLTLGFYLRRKIFGHFLDSYTKNVVEQKFIINELDVYTTQEELIAYNMYLKSQQERLVEINEELKLHKNLLLEAQALGGIGSFSINYKDHSKSVYTPEYQRIFEMEGLAESFDKFIERVVPADRKKLLAKIEVAYKKGGAYEVEYRYKKTRLKHIWSKGFILAEDGKPSYIRGIVKEIKPKKKK